MKVLKRRIVEVDIGPLDHKVRLPVASRSSAGMKTVCDACGESITDEYFIGGFKAGYPNMKLHESCADSDGCNSI